MLSVLERARLRESFPFFFTWIDGRPTEFRNEPTLVKLIFAVIWSNLCLYLFIFGHLFGSNKSATWFDESSFDCPRRNIKSTFFIQKQQNSKNHINPDNTHTQENLVFSQICSLSLAFPPSPFLHKKRTEDQHTHEYVSLAKCENDQLIVKHSTSWPTNTSEKKTIGRLITTHMMCNWLPMVIIDWKTFLCAHEQEGFLFRLNCGHTWLLLKFWLKLITSLKKKWIQSIITSRHNWGPSLVMVFEHSITTNSPLIFGHYRHFFIALHHWDAHNWPLSCSECPHSNKILSACWPEKSRNVFSCVFLQPTYGGSFFSFLTLIAKVVLKAFLSVDQYLVLILAQHPFQSCRLVRRAKKFPLTREHIIRGN